MNHGLINVLRLNLRKLKQVIGDLFSLAACSHAEHKRLIELLDVIAVANCAEADHLQRPDGDREGGRRGDPARVDATTAALTAAAEWQTRVGDIPAVIFPVGATWTAIGLGPLPREEAEARWVQRQGGGSDRRPERKRLGRGVAR